MQQDAACMLPGSFVFQRDMFLKIPIIADLQSIQERRQVLINEKLRGQNLKHRRFDYAVDQEVLIKVPQPKKIDDRNKGPYRISQVHTNGTVTIQRTNHITERRDSYQRVFLIRPAARAKHELIRGLRGYWYCRTYGTSTVYAYKIFLLNMIF
jgi:hypothetical protein